MKKIMPNLYLDSSDEDMAKSYIGYASFNEDIFVLSYKNRTEYRESKLKQLYI